MFTKLIQKKNNAQKRDKNVRNKPDKKINKVKIKENDGGRGK